MGFTSQIETADGVYDLLIEQAGGTTEDRPITLLQEVVTRWGDSGNGWGSPILPSTTTVTLYDPAQEVISVLDGADRREWTLRITGPNGYDWRGWYSAEPMQRPFLSTRRGERPTFELLFYDGLADLDAKEGNPNLVPRIFAAIRDVVRYDADPAVYTDMEWQTKFAGTLSGEGFGNEDESDAQYLALGGFLDPESNAGENKDSIVQLLEMAVGGYLRNEIKDMRDAVEYFCKATDTQLRLAPSIGRPLFTPRQRVGEALTYRRYGVTIDNSGIFPSEEFTNQPVEVPGRTVDLSPQDGLAPTYEAIQDAGYAEVEFPTNHSLFTEDYTVTGGRPYGGTQEDRWVSINLEAQDTAQPNAYPNTWKRETDYFETTARVVLDADIDTPLSGSSAATEITNTLEWVDRDGTVQYSNTETYDVADAESNDTLPIEARIGLDVQGEGKIVSTWEVTAEPGSDVGARILQAVRLGEYSSFSLLGGSIQIVDSYILSDNQNLLVEASNARGKPMTVEPEPYMNDFLPLASDSDNQATTGPVELFRDTYWGVEARNPHLFRGIQRAAAQSAAVQTLSARILGVYPPEYALTFEDKPGVKYAPGEGRKITIKPGRSETQLYDLELPSTPP